MCFSYLLLTEAGVRENLAIQYSVVTVSLKPTLSIRKCAILAPGSSLFPLVASLFVISINHYFCCWCKLDLV